MNLFLSLTLFFLLIPLAQAKTRTFSHYKNSSNVGFPNNLNGKDFFTLRTNSFSNNSEQLFAKDTTECREQIKKAICLVDPMKDDEDFKTRRCLDGGQSYASYFESLYDNYPPALQQMFCSLNRIFIERQFGGTAYASSIDDEQGNPNGAIIGIRKSVLDESLSLSTWSSWKEQLSFGGITDSYTLTPELPHVITSSTTRTNDFLYFVIAHEFGHLFDFANGLNNRADCPEPESEEDEMPECNMAEGSFGSISWKTDQQTNSESDFKNRESLCFYACAGNTLNKTDVSDLYKLLLRKNFISTYAATNPWDDFAESLAYYMLDKNLNAQYVLDTKQGQYYDSISKLSDPIFNVKLKFIEDFLKRSDIIYP